MEFNLKELKKYKMKRLLDNAINSAAEELVRLVGLIKTEKKGLEDYRIIQSKKTNKEMENKIEVAEKDKNIVAVYLLKLEQIKKEGKDA